MNIDQTSGKTSAEIGLAAWCGFFQYTGGSMARAGPSGVALDVYDVSEEEAVLDLSGQELRSVPDIVNAKNICTLYLQNNAIEEIPNDFFPTLPNLMWLDFRDNRITAIPQTIRFHPNLSHLLLQNNRIASLPNELGTLTNLKTLQVSGNPLHYPPKTILEQGVRYILKYLNTKFEEKLGEKFDVISECSEDGGTNSSNFGCHVSSSDNIEESNLTTKPELNISKAKTPLSIQLSDKEAGGREDFQPYAKREGKCPKLPKSRQKVLPNYCQSRKYLKPLRAECKDEQTAKMRQCYLRELAQTRHKELVAQREKIIQDRKNLSLLRDWRNGYKRSQALRSRTGGEHAFDPSRVPYATSADCLAMPSREELERELPDEYRRRLARRGRGAAPRARAAADRQLAGKIKQLFENLEKISLNRETMTPRTEQQMLLNEIHKISEIRQKLNELSSTNFSSVTT